ARDRTEFPDIFMRNGDVVAGGHAHFQVLEGAIQQIVAHGLTHHFRFNFFSIRSIISPTLVSWCNSSVSNSSSSPVSMAMIREIWLSASLFSTCVASRSLVSTNPGICSTSLIIGVALSTKL